MEEEFVGVVARVEGLRGMLGESTRGRRSCLMRYSCKRWTMDDRRWKSNGQTSIVEGLEQMR
jgi:hypothetical protein